MVEVVERDDEAHVVLAHEPGERVHVVGIGDAGDDRLPVGVVERRGERVRVGGERDRTGGPERPHDVDALPGAREEDDRHERRAYSRPARRPEEFGGARIT